MSNKTDNRKWLEIGLKIITFSIGNLKKCIYIKKFPIKIRKFTYYAYSACRPDISTKYISKLPPPLTKGSFDQLTHLLTVKLGN